MSEKISSGHIGRAEHGLSASHTRKPFAEPKLTFIEPKLTRHGDVTRITGNGFFSAFVP